MKLFAKNEFLYLLSLPKTLLFPLPHLRNMYPLISIMEVIIVYVKIRNDKDREFRRWSGVKGSTFNKRIDIRAEAEKKKKVRGGKPNPLPIEEWLWNIEENIEQTFMPLFFLGNRGKLLLRNIKWIEDTLSEWPMRLYVDRCIKETHRSS